MAIRGALAFQLRFPHPCGTWSPQTISPEFYPIGIIPRRHIPQKGCCELTEARCPKRRRESLQFLMLPGRQPAHGTAVLLPDGDFGVGAAFIVDDKGTGLVDGRWENGKYIEGLKNPAQNYAWQFYYARMADNIPIMLNTIAGGSTGSEFQISWNYEYICFTVDNNGIASVHWMSPIAIGDVVQENAVLKSFPEIMGVFEKMVRVQYEPMLNTRYPDGNIEINVDDIELCLMRVREPNGDGTTGLLVPAWVFYGHNIATHSTGEQSFDFSGGIAYRWPQAPIVLFAINAIDGSVINFTWGY